MGFVLGISAYFHESSVALFKDGDLIFFCREEYFSRIKADKSFPRLCLNYCKKTFGLNEKNIDRVVFYEKPLRSFLISSKVAFQNFPASFWLLINNFMKIRKSGMFFYSDFKKTINVPTAKLSFCPHHLSHAYSVIPFSNKDEPHLSLVLDGFGDVFSTSAYLVENQKISLLKSVDYPGSLGLLYSAITEHLGFRINDGEFKVMALAAYGDGSLNAQFRKTCGGTNTGEINLNAFKFYKSISEHLDQPFYAIFGKKREEMEVFPQIGTEDFQKLANLANAAQSYIEVEVKNLVLELIDKTSIQTIYLSGGVALNSKLVSSLKEIKALKKVFVPPNPGDSGAAIGAGVFGCLLSGQDVTRNHDAFLGPSTVNQNSILQKFGEKVDAGQTATQKTAKLISEGNIIAILNGKSEVGPRALGNRSLVCDPRNQVATLELSTKLKRREQFRPVAPAVLESEAENWFTIPLSVKKCLPWMACLAEAKPKTKELLPSICHIDGSARIQTVMPTQVDFYQLIERFKQLTGVPILVNTSLNCGGDPIVLDVHDLITTMLRMKIKYTLCNGDLWKLDEKHFV